MDKLNAIAQQLAAIWKRISFNQRVSIVLVAVVAFIGLWIFAKIAYRPSTALLYPQALEPEDAAAIADKLRDEGIKFSVRDGGRRIYVPSQRVDELRLSMAGAGLPANTGSKGWDDIFTGRGLGGQSDAMLNINKLRALQGELARTISSLSGVQSARVHLVIPETRIFEKDQEPATASVVLSLRAGYAPSPSEISGIRYLCSSAIEGLKTNNVTILDGNGQVLARPREEDDLLEMSGQQIEQARQREREYTDKILAQLVPSVGKDNVSATVTVELVNERVETTETKTTSGTVVEEEISESTSSTSKAERGGEPGVASNTGEAEPSAGSGGGSSDTTSTTRTRTIPNTTEKKLVMPPGSIKCVSASVILNKDRGTSENGTALSVADVQTLVKAVIMYDDTRGDQVSVHEVSFAPAEKSEAQAVSMPSPIITGIAKHGPAAIVSIALLGFLWVFMKKARFAEDRGDMVPSTSTATASARASGRGGGRGEGDAAVPELGASDKKVKEIFDEIVLEESEAELRGLREAMGRLADQKPESVAAVIREWIS
jgi:flagellar M-ring protein FliF